VDVARYDRTAAPNSSVEADDHHACVQTELTPGKQGRAFSARAADNQPHAMQRLRTLRDRPIEDGGPGLAELTAALRAALDRSGPTVVEVPAQTARTSAVRRGISVAATT
jgi:hypothetical protein